MVNQDRVEAAYILAKEAYAELGVDTDKALSTTLNTPLSMHCWQADDVGGFEVTGGTLDGGGIQVTGNNPGKARNVDELRADLEQTFALIPGKQRLNLHAIYGEFGGKVVDRDAIEPEHFKGWVDWAKAQGVKLDFNASCFSHPKSDDGFTLSSLDAGIRDFWIEHAKRARTIGAYLGREVGSPCVHNLWIPDGYKDTPFDRWAPRKHLKESLDTIFADTHAANELKDAVECKLFGIGSESFVTGSHEFYMGYAIQNGKMVCLDTGHFHPTETIADKISSVLLFSDEVLLHLSRGVRWDSDHVATMTDDQRSIFAEIVAGDALGRVNLALDFFDASINRTIAYVTGMRGVQKSLLCALLMPAEKIRAAEAAGDLGTRLALLEECKTQPFGAVWDMLCMKAEVPVAGDWIQTANDYQAKVTADRA
ncbi:MAG: L-rhamnose isomerase [Planctomycetota bacterium]